MQQMLQDKRKIISVQNDYAEVTMWAIGKNGVTKIECYPEPGEYCEIPYLAIYQGEFLYQRSPAARFRIVYEDDFNEESRHHPTTAST